MDRRASDWYKPQLSISINQWLTEFPGLSVNLLMLLCLTHLCFPRARRHTRKFFELSYYNPESGEYCAGWNDAWMVFYWIVVFTGLRAAVMDYVLTPFAKNAGAKTERDQTRFAEQAWLLIYYSVFWTLGMVRRNSLDKCEKLTKAVHSDYV
jgi:acyl-CoA-dependent ceramide synthase